MVDVVQRVSEQVFIPLTVGGGIRSVEDVRRMLKAGADKVSLNTAAVNGPDLVAQGAAVPDRPEALVRSRLPHGRRRSILSRSEPLLPTVRGSEHTDPNTCLKGL